MDHPRDPDDVPVSFLSRPPGPAFRTAVVVVAPGCSHPYDAAEWRDALVVVEYGEVEIECRDGGCRSFGRGSVLWLSGMPLLALHNRGLESVVLLAVSRRAL